MRFCHIFKADRRLYWSTPVNYFFMYFLPFMMMMPL